MGGCLGTPGHAIGDLESSKEIDEIVDGIRESRGETRTTAWTERGAMRGTCENLRGAVR